MKRIKTTLLSAVLLVAAFSLVTSAVTINENVQIDNRNQDPDPLSQYAQISCYLYEGDGCGCVPIREAFVYAYALDTAHNDSGFTDEDGLVILELEYEYTYRITIEVDQFVKILFDFNVLDDQTLTFHLQEEEESSLQRFPVLHTFVQRLQMIADFLE